jgi:hypothetical protein
MQHPLISLKSQQISDFKMKRKIITQGSSSTIKLYSGFGIDLRNPL